MSEPEKKTYTLDELAKLINWHKASLKVFLRKMNVDPDELIEEEDAAALATRVRRPWPPKAD